jgi:phospholipid/cholesterol/gamma-HCH transport system substrate-binding protein
VKRAIRDHWKDFAAILGLLIFAGAVSAIILTEQRFRFPLISEKPTRMYAELDNAQAVTPGQGQTVEVAGVKVGLIANVKLRDGHAVIGLDIKPRFKDVIHTDAKGLLRPRTGLKDMFLQVDPGSNAAPLAKEGFTIPAARTLTDVDLDEILSSLDADTRDHLQLLLGGAAGGLKGRGMDLAELFRRFGPTTRDLRRVNQAVAVEREGIKDATHGLAQITDELAGKDDDLARLVDSSAAVFEAFASEDRNVSATVQKLPAALQTTTRTLADVKRFADQLGPTARSLTPVFQTLDKTNRVITPIAKQLTPVIGGQIRPFVREARPLVANLRPAATGLSAAMPDLTTVGTKLNTLFNLLAYNKDGAEPADKASRSESYLFWLAWLTHQTENLINVDDANGPMRPIFLTGTCNTITNLVDNEPGLEFLLGLSGVLAQQCDNPSTASILPDLAKKRVAKDAKAFDKTREASQSLMSGDTTQSALKTILEGAGK